MTESTMSKILNWAYEKALHGVLGVESAAALAEDYRIEGRSSYESANALIRWQNTKAATAGFVTGIGGLVTLPVAMPANIASVLLIQVRMIAAIAHLGGRDLKDDRVKALVFACLAGNSMKEVWKQAGIQIVGQLTENAIRQYVTKEAVSRINQAVGFRLLAKMGEKGVINLGRVVPLLGGVVGGAVDAYMTNLIGNVAREVFTPRV